MWLAGKRERLVYLPVHFFNLHILSTYLGSEYVLDILFAVCIHDFTESYHLIGNNGVISAAACMHACMWT